MKASNNNIFIILVLKTENIVVHPTCTKNPTNIIKKPELLPRFLNTSFPHPIVLKLELDISSFLKLESVSITENVDKVDV